MFLFFFLLFLVGELVQVLRPQTPTASLLYCITVFSGCCSVSLLSPCFGEGENPPESEYMGNWGFAHIDRRICTEDGLHPPGGLKIPVGFVFPGGLVLPGGPDPSGEPALQGGFALELYPF